MGPPRSTIVWGLRSSKKPWPRPGSRVRVPLWPLVTTRSKPPGLPGAAITLTASGPLPPDCRRGPARRGDLESNAVGLLVGHQDDGMAVAQILGVQGDAAAGHLEGAVALALPVQHVAERVAHQQIQEAGLGVADEGQAGRCGAG